MNSHEQTGKSTETQMDPAQCRLLLVFLSSYLKLKMQFQHSSLPSCSFWLSFPSFSLFGTISLWNQMTWDVFRKAFRFIKHLSMRIWLSLKSSKSSVWQRSLMSISSNQATRLNSCMSWDNRTLEKIVQSLQRDLRMVKWKLNKDQLKLEFYCFAILNESQFQKNIKRFLTQCLRSYPQFLMCSSAFLLKSITWTSNEESKRTWLPKEF